MNLKGCAGDLFFLKTEEGLKRKRRRLYFLEK
jgi:hypothetical protein